MEILNRYPLQGVMNIIRFNWHFYLLAGLLLAVLLFFGQEILVWFMAGSMILSLAVSWYVYDASGLYTFRWLDFSGSGHPRSIVNIHAGFDETSGRLFHRYPGAALQVFDFYDPGRHTEVSISRARKAYAPCPGTRKINTNAIPLAAGSADVIFLFFSAHEIRNFEERCIFFNELRRCLSDDGKIIVLEHLRDAPNFIAYNVGFLHFFSKREWKRTFEQCRLDINREKKVTPFLSAFILQKNGIAS